MQRRFGLGQPITQGAKYLLIAMVGVSLLFALTPADVQVEMLRYLIATDHSVWKQGYIWQLLTTALIPVRPDGSLDFVSLIFQGLMLYMFLPTLENWWGTKRFLRFALWTTLAGSVAGTLVGLALPGTHVVSGLDPFVFAGVIAFGVLFADRQVQFFGVVPMTGKQLTIGMSVVVGAFLIIGQAWAEGASMAAAVLLALGLTTGKFAPKLWYLKWKQKRIRKKLRIVKDDDEPKKWMN
ncbi:MAG: hypothetical protein KJO07_02910 [Deltaproteobacteria bacterium]|nr:hypothetical protein [Deltaproteobacteria bacterium]